MSDKKKKLSPAQWEIAMRYMQEFERKNNRLMSVTALTVLPLIGYIVGKIEDMDAKLDNNNSFSMKLKNKSNNAIRACDEFIKTFEDLIVSNKDGYGHMTDMLYPCLDSWFDTLVAQKDVAPSSEVIRRAKLRYHDPFVAKVKECQNAFEDGYEKGYCDCVNDVTKELAKLVQQDIETAVIKIDGGKVNIEPVLKEEKPCQTKN